MPRIFRLSLAAAALVALPEAVPAEPMPRPEQIATPPERPILRRLEALATGMADRPAAQAELDAILATLRQPTPLRGFIQYLRASLLYDDDRVDETRAAVEEAIRLLPDYSGPLFLAAVVEGYADRPAPATDYLLRAAAIDPDLAAGFHAHDLLSIVRRLRANGDEARLARLAERLFAIGWRGDDLDLRSSLARDVIQHRVANGELARAREMIPNVVVPAHARELLMRNDYRALWPDLEAWAGPRLSRLWPVYLREARDRWAVSRDSRFALDYARALTAAGHNRTLIAALLPALTGPLDRMDFTLVYVAPTVAAALAQQGRWAELEGMFAHADRTWPLGSEANALNISANRGRYRMLAGDAEGALLAFDLAIADSARWQGQVSAQALATMHANRACALHRLGRSADALSSIAFASGNAATEVVVEMHLCLERPALARNIIRAALGIEARRSAALTALQPDGALPVRSPVGTAMRARWEALRNDPELRTEVARYGRILPYSLSDGAPAETPAP